MQAPLLILFGSQTGQSQDVAERMGREAKALLFAPRVMSMDAYDIKQLPSESRVVFVIATAGQGQFPDNAQSFWKFLLRKSLPPDSLVGLSYAVFGLGDSGYPKYNVAAKKLDRRLAGLGASGLVPLGLGDDQHPSGYEAVLDPWLPTMWAALRALCPLPAGIQQPVLDESTLVSLGQPRYKVTLIPLPRVQAAALQPQPDPNLAVDPATIAAATTIRAASGNGIITSDNDTIASTVGSNTAAHGTANGTANGIRVSDASVAAPANVAHWPPGIGAPAAANDGASELLSLVSVAAAFRAVAAQASGTSAPSSPPQPTAADHSGTGLGGPGHAPAGYGPWRPFPTSVLVNRRLTSPAHSQDVRHIELSLAGSGMEQYAPGDLLTVWPRPESEAVDALLARLGWDGDQLVEVSAAEPSLPGQALEVARGSLRAFAEAVLDIAGASPRRRFFQMLAHFTPESSELELERLQYFASTEGRDDLYRYNQREGRTVLEVLQDFKSCRPSLEWLLETAPLLKPRQFSISSSARMHPGHAHLTVAVVQWNTPYKRQRRGLCSTYLASRRSLEATATAAAAAAAAGIGTPPSTGIASAVTAAVNGTAAAEASTPASETLSSTAAGKPAHSTGALAQLPTSSAADCVAVWVERGCMQMPASLATPLVLVGPGTGVAPFRGFLEERAALLAQAQSRQSASAPPPAATWQEDPSRRAASGPEPSQAAAFGAPQPSAPPQGPLAPYAAAPAACCLFVGCRKRQGDAYYLEQWQAYQQMGVLLQQPHGLTVAASQDQPQKVYVTHNIQEHGAALWDLIHRQGATVCVSGSAQKMPSDVAAAFEAVAVQHGGLSREQAAQLLRQMELQGRYLVETWS